MPQEYSNHSNSQDLAAFEERFFATRPRIITSLCQYSMVLM